jgi:hypothetical protein
MHGHAGKQGTNAMRSIAQAELPLAAKLCSDGMPAVWPETQSQYAAAAHVVCCLPTTISHINTLKQIAMQGSYQVFQV